MASGFGGAAAGFAGYPKYIFLTGGTLLTNLVWWGIVCVWRGTLREFIEVPGGADPQALEERGADGEVRTLFSASGRAANAARSVCSWAGWLSCCFPLA